VEKEPDNFAHLQSVTAGYPAGVVTNYGPGEFSRYVDRILEDIGDCAALFFLDPFGIDGLEWSTLKPILERSQRHTTELLINFNVRYVPRLAGHLTSQASAAQSKVELLTSVLGTGSWQECVRPNAEELSDAEVVPLGECIGALYEHQVRGYFRHVYHYAVRSVADTLVRYHLIFATSHDKGLAVMSDILCRTEKQYQTERERLEARPAVQMPLFEEAREPTEEEIIAARGRELRETVCEKVRSDSRRRMTFLRLQAAVAEAGFFAKVKRTTYCAELKTLRSQGQVSWGSQTRQPEDDEEILWCG
jgi:three-Cys-motif partner protein